MSSYGIGRMIGRCFSAAPLLSSCAVILGVAGLGYSCTSKGNGGTSDPDAVVEYQRRLAKEAEDRKATEAALAEAAKSPAQRASEAAAAAREAAVAAAREKRIEAEQAKFELAVDRFAAQYSNQHWQRRCVRWGSESRRGIGKVGAEAMRRNLRNESLITGVDEAHVVDRLPAVGMTACGAFAVLGMPSDHNATTTALSTSVQWVFSDIGVYVYTRSRPGDFNGTVDSVQH